MDDAELLEELANGRSQTEMGALLGVRQSFVSMVLHGERRLGAGTVRRMIAAFPERREHILNTLFPLAAEKEAR